MLDSGDLTEFFGFIEEEVFSSVQRTKWILLRSGNGMTDILLLFHFLQEYQIKQIYHYILNIQNKKKK